MPSPVLQLKDWQQSVLEYIYALGFQRRENRAMKAMMLILILWLLALTLWGCPTRKYIPDPMPPQPQAQRLEDYPGYRGREPYVGPKVQFRYMLAQGLLHNPFVDIGNSAS